MFLISNKLEQLEFKMEQILGFRNMQEKLEKFVFLLIKNKSINLDLHLINISINIAHQV